MTLVQLVIKTRRAREREGGGGKKGEMGKEGGGGGGGREKGERERIETEHNFVSFSSEIKQEHHKNSQECLAYLKFVYRK